MVQTGVQLQGKMSTVFLTVRAEHSLIQLPSRIMGVLRLYRPGSVARFKGDDVCGAWQEAASINITANV